MSWRTVVISSCAKLDYQMGYLVVRKDEEVRIHLSEVSLLIIETTAVSLTAALLCELTKKKIKVVFCDEKRNPLGELMPYYGSHDTSIKIKKQIAWSKGIKSLVWTEIVREKIFNQAMHLKKYNKSEASLLERYIQELEIGDVTNREGHAAKVYFNALFGKDFTRNDENSINAALNYGYSLILSLLNREVVSNGYLTQLGIFHDNMFNQFNLASDLVEPFRIIVDNRVKEMMPKKFEREEKLELLQIFSEQVDVADRKEYFSNAVKVYCKSVLDALNENDPSLIKFVRNEF